MIENRKEEHVRICATKPVSASYNYWDDVFLIHQALPELNKSEIDLTSKLFKKKLSAPIIISALTGGYSKAKKINSNLAKAASELQIGLGVGSQRPALQENKFKDSYTVVKEFDLPLVIGNIGAPQLVRQRAKDRPLSVADGKAALAMVGADILAIHMNFVQELVQPEGDSNAKGCLKKIAEFASKLPILAKETGAGISKEMANALKTAGVKGIDVGGLSGTSFPAVEIYRGKANSDDQRPRLGETFWNWGIPTPVSLFEAKVGLPLIATGGIRNGLDAAKAICLGASSAGLAGRLLKPALKSAKSVVSELELIIDELRSALFLMGAKDIKSTHKQKVVIIGKTQEILRSMGYLK
ncbi:type 2 isopentenyl-diphosphate Delta-isomerase [[Eubacterium] cellulosolvens]